MEEKEDSFSNEIVLEKNDPLAEMLMKKSFIKIGDNYYVTLRFYYKCFKGEESFQSFYRNFYKKMYSGELRIITINVIIEEKKYTLVRVPDPNNERFLFYKGIANLPKKGDVPLQLRVPLKLVPHICEIKSPTLNPEYLKFYKFVENAFKEKRFSVFIADDLYGGSITNLSVTVWRRDFYLLKEISKTLNMKISSIISCSFWNYLKEFYPEYVAGENHKTEVSDGDNLSTNQHVEGGSEESIQTATA